MKTMIAFVLFFLSIYLFGFWLSRAGRPHNTLLLTFHKLIALAAMVVLIIVANHAYQAAPLSIVAISSVILAVLFFLIAGISGGLVSASAEMPVEVALIHKISPHLAAFSTAVGLYLLLTRT